MNYFLVLGFGQVEFWSSDTRQTDRQTDGQKAMHMSPPCISTGVLKKGAGALTSSNMTMQGGFR